MRDGYKIIDMDTHVGPPMEILEKYVEPSFRDRLPELDPYRRTFVRPDGVAATNLTAGAIPYDRFPGTAPTADDETPVIGGRGALEGRTIKFHRAPTTPGVEEENVDGRIADMDREGRDVDFIFPSPWAATLTAVADQTLAQGMYRAYHRYMAEYSHKYPDRIKSSIQVNAADVEWAISEVNEMAKEKWASAVWVHLPAGTPVDHPKLEPLWAAMNEADLPLIHHSFFMEPPYFPGYRDIWGNARRRPHGSPPMGRRASLRLPNCLRPVRPLSQLPRRHLRGGPRLAAQLAHPPRLPPAVRPRRHPYPQVHPSGICSDGQVPLRRRGLRGSRNDQSLRRNPRHQHPHAPVRLPPRPVLLPRDRQDGHGVGLLAPVRPRRPPQTHVRQRRRLPSPNLRVLPT